MFNKRQLSFALIAGAGTLAVVVAGYLRSDPDSAGAPTEVVESIVEPAAGPPDTSENAAASIVLTDAAIEPAVEADEVVSEPAEPELAGAEGSSAPATSANDVATGPEPVAEETEIAPVASAGPPLVAPGRSVGDGGASRTSLPARVAGAAVFTGAVEQQTKDVVPASGTESESSTISTAADALSAANPAPVETAPPVVASDGDDSAIETDSEDDAVAPTVTAKVAAGDSGGLEAAPDTRPADSLAAMKGDELAAAPELDKVVLAAKGEPLVVDEGDGDRASEDPVHVAGEAPADPLSDASALASGNRPALVASDNSDPTATGSDLSMPVSEPSAAKPAEVQETVASAKDETLPAPDRSIAGAVPASTSPTGTEPVVGVTAPKSREIAQIHFDKNSYYLSPGAQVMIGRALESLSAMEGTVRVEVAGYTDRVGSESYNLWLAERRVQRVIDALAQAGIQRASLSGFPIGPFELPVPTDVGISEPLNRCVSVSVVAAD